MATVVFNFQGDPFCTVSLNAKGTWCRPVMVLHTAPVCTAARPWLPTLIKLDALTRTVKLGSASTQYAPWLFLSDPTRVKDTMVLIVTPTLQAGHSIDEHTGESQVGSDMATTRHVQYGSQWDSLLNIIFETTLTPYEWQRQTLVGPPNLLNNG
jgi:hypothetical protein